MGVLSDGSYALCGIGTSVPDLIFGHAAADRLEDVWLNSQKLQELRQGLPDRLEGVCGRCLMKNVCLGSCLAQNYYRDKRLWAPYWFCQEAEMAGLFPTSRIR
ncbi:MAG: SPASM domain-containing protein [Methanotrichaceae archaeon]|nr:SPASM domain-containing protein [Methanotrichaceae archaeon]